MRKARKKHRSRSLFGSEISVANSGRAAIIFAAVTAATLAAVLIALPLVDEDWRPSVLLASRIPVAASVLSVLFGATWWLLRLPAERRFSAQIALAAAIVVVTMGIYAVPAPIGATLRSFGELTADEWPLAVIAFLAALAAGYFLHRRLWVRGFILAAGVLFFLTWTDFLGVYGYDTGETRMGPLFTRTPTLNRIWAPVGTSPEEAAAHRATGSVAAWYLTCLVAAWLPLLYWRLRRSRAAAAATGNGR
jgi:hypothetical protein